MKTFAFGIVSLVFSAAMVGACGASGNPVSGDDTVKTGVTDASVTDSAVLDAGYGGQQDSGTTTTTDSGGVTPIDSGTSLPPDDAGVIFTGGGTCDITDGLTVTVEEIVTFITENNPASCGSGDPCDSSHCCLDVAAASGSGSLPLGTPTGICLTSLNLKALGL
jgi:hypothetical protein